MRNGKVIVIIVVKITFLGWPVDQGGRLTRELFY
jgi:hypothetical protein